MESPQLGFGARLWLAFTLPWRLLFNATLAGRVARGLSGAPALEPSPVTPVAKEPAKVEPTAALQLLAILQREGRLIDFLQEDVADFSDAQIGAAARVVHEGCKRGLDPYLELGPVRGEAEGDPVTLEAGFDATRVRITGNVTGAPPYRGRLAHHGWQVKRVELPTLTGEHDARVIAPAEVEL
ncbi:MAG: DUF2760 domain-containing protein [Myxococcales bacterium]|nr:DUF2760 domain-containing protein [Myxococcales bacterium]